MQTIRLFIVNCNKPALRGLSSLFAAQGGFDVVGEAQYLDDLEHPRRLQPDVVLYGMNRCDEKTVSAISSLKEVCPCTLVIVLSDASESTHALAAFTAGADGCINTPILPADLVTSVRLTCRTGICFFPRTARESLISFGSFPKRRTGNGGSESTCV